MELCDGIVCDFDNPHYIYMIGVIEDQGTFMFKFELEDEILEYFGVKL